MCRQAHRSRKTEGRPSPATQRETRPRQEAWYVGTSRSHQVRRRFNPRIRERRLRQRGGVDPVGAAISRARTGLGLVLLAAVSVAWRAALAAEPLFRALEAETVQLSNRPAALALADVDLDGRPDLAVAHAESGTVSVLRNDGTGLALASTTKVGLSPLALAAGDVDRDGAPDLVVVNSGSASMSVLLGDGVGRFRPADEVPLPDHPRDVGLADFDLAGDLDAATISDVLGRDLGVFTVLRGDGDGGFRGSATFAVGDNPHSLVIADLDRDGGLDVAILHTETLSVFRGHPDGTFEAPLRTKVTANPRFLAEGDFDADGLLDLAFTNDDEMLRVLHNRGAGELSESAVLATGISAGREPGGFVLADDFDRDGRDDIVLQVRRGSTHAIVAGSGISSTPWPGMGSAENFVRYVGALSESTYSA